MEAQADTVVILSSELIEQVVEAYFNRTMFKQQVHIVESKPTESGYMFSVAFAPQRPPTQIKRQMVQEAVAANGVAEAVRPAEYESQRDEKGRFVQIRK